MGDQFLLEILEQRGDHIPMLKAVDVNLELILFDLYLPLNALNEMLIDGLWLHRGEGLWKIYSEVIIQMK